MKKSIFKKLYAPELTEQLARYAPADEEMLVRSEEKLQLSKTMEDARYENEVHGVVEYRKYRFAPVVSLAACAVLVAGIGGIFALQKYNPVTDMNPGSTVQDEEAPHYMHHMFSSLTTFDMADLNNSEMYFITEESATQYYSIPAEQQAQLAALISDRESWEILPEDRDYFMTGGSRIQMYVQYDGLYSVVTFWSDGAAVQEFLGGQKYWWYTTRELYDQVLELIGTKEKPCSLASYRTWQAVVGAPQSVMKEIFGISQDVNLDFSQNIFLNLDLNQAELFVMSDAYAPQYYIVSEQQQAAFAALMDDRDGWEITLEAWEECGEAAMEAGTGITVYLSSPECQFDSHVTFWSNGIICQYIPTSETSHVGYYFYAAEDTYTRVLEILGTPAELYPLTDSYANLFAHRYDSKEDQHAFADAALKDIFTPGAPFGDVSGESVQVMCTAYAPCAAAIPADAQQALADAMSNAVWREIDKDTPAPDGEFISLYVWNMGEPYVLHFYADSSVLWDNGAEQRKFRTSADLWGLVNETVDYQNVTDHLTWVEPSDNMREDVWKAVNAAAAEADLSAYQAVLDEFNHKHRVCWAIVTPEDNEATGRLYEEVIAEILAMTPEEYGAYLEERYSKLSREFPFMPYLDGDFTVAYRHTWDNGGTEMALTLTDEERAELTALVNDTYWNGADAKESDEDCPERDRGTMYDNAFVIRYENLTLTICPDEHLAIWFADIGDNYWSNGYFETWDELESLLNGIEK